MSVSAADAKSAQKKQAAYKAVDSFVRSGTTIGLGTGSTSFFAVERVGQRLASGEIKNVKAVPTSEATAQLAHSLGIPLTTLDDESVLDVAIDGADTADGRTFGLVKGGGGALLREKLVAAAAKQFVVIADGSKLADGLGAAFPLPVELIQYAHEHILQKVAALPSIRGCEAILRLRDDGSIYVTDNGNFIVDLHFREPIPDPELAAKEIEEVVGVVEHGLFLGMANAMVVAAADGVTVYSRKK